MDRNKSVELYKQLATQEWHVMDCLDNYFTIRHKDYEMLISKISLIFTIKWHTRICCRISHPFFSTLTSGWHKPLGACMYFTSIISRMTSHSRKSKSLYAYVVSLVACLLHCCWLYIKLIQDGTLSAQCFLTARVCQNPWLRSEPTRWLDHSVSISISCPSTTITSM